MSKPIVNVSATRKGSTVTLTDGRWAFDRRPATSGEEIRAVITAPMACALYKQAVKQVEAYPKTYLRGLPFKALLDECDRLLATRLAIRGLRELHSSGHGKVAEKAGEELHTVFRRVFATAHETKPERFTRPELAVLNARSDNFIGDDTNYWDFVELFDPVKDDDSAMRGLAVAFKTYPFDKYVQKSIGDSIRETTGNHFSEVMSHVEAFRRFRDVAGDDLVNWGPHKFASQAKRLKLPNHWQIQSWCKKVAENQIKKGIVPREAKQTATQRLKARAVEGGELTQADYIRLFKSAGEGNAHEYVTHMTPATAASLLAATTKNVTSKLIEVRERYGRHDKDRVLPQRGLKAIASVVAEHETVDHVAFQALRDYFRKNNTSVVRWSLLKRFAGHYTIAEFCAWVERDSRELEYGDLTDPFKPEHDTFYHEVLAKLPEERRYKLHPQVTSAFIAHMTDGERSDFLRSYRAVPAVLARMGAEDTTFAEVHWGRDALLFHKLSYAEIKSFLISTDPDDRSKRLLSDLLPHFISPVIEARDTELAALAFEVGASDARLYPLLTFDQRVEVLRRPNYQESLKKVFNPRETERFRRIAISDRNLTCYFQDRELSLKGINELVANVKHPCLPVTHAIVDALSKRSILKLLAGGGFNYDHTSDNYLMQAVYGKINRAEWDALGKGEPKGLEMVDIMTQQEIDEAAMRDERVFLRDCLDRVSDTHLAMYHRPEAFKAVVGDRRKPRNNSFAIRLEARLEPIRKKMK